MWKFERRELFRRVGIVAAAKCFGKSPQQEAPTCPVHVELNYGTQMPTQIPIVPSLNIGRSFFSYDDDAPPKGKRYEPAAGGGYGIHNGPDAYNYLLVGDGVWSLAGGDKPILGLRHRSPINSYATPALLPDLGVGGRFRLHVRVGDRSKWLDEFESIDTRLTPGVATWRCRDPTFALTVGLEAHPLISCNGFIVSARIASEVSRPIRLTWAFGRIGETGDVVELRKNYALVKNPQLLPETQVFAGPVGDDCQLEKGASQILAASSQPPAVATDTSETCALCSVTVEGEPGKEATTQLLGVWGYSGYDDVGVEEAFSRLEGRPFADGAWLQEMKKKWFNHWIGRALEPEQKFLEVRGHAEEALQESINFWDHNRRLRIETPDSDFDNVVNNEAANMWGQFEYPAFIHGAEGSSKYGKINCGYYGAEAAGYHDEVGSSLKFISGAQDEKGRQGYFTPAFATLVWAEQVDFYYVEQVWYHFRWTGDREFLQKMWPSVRRSLEHALAAGDPNCKGIMTGYYEYWNNDMHSRGGKCAVHTGMAWAALKSAAEMARWLGDRNSAARYQDLTEKVYQQLHRELYSTEVGAYCSAEWNGKMRPHPEAQEQFLLVMRGAGGPMERYMAMRYVRETLFLRPQPDVTLELLNDWWPIGWSHHYVASGDTALSFLAACKTGDVDNYWPALKTITAGAYRSRNATLQSTQLNDGTGVGFSNMTELQPTFLQAVVEGLFGVNANLGENQMALHPNFPHDWTHAEIATPDISYNYRIDGGAVSLLVKTPEKRRVRVEIPVRGSVRRITVNEEEAEYTIASEVSQARIVVESPEGFAHRFVCEVASEPTIRGKTDIVVGRMARFEINGATVRHVLDPQKKLRNITSVQSADGSFEASFVPAVSGQATVFLELAAGKTTYLHPLDLHVQDPWSIANEYVPAFKEGGPSVSSPKVETESKTAVIKLANHLETEMRSPATVTIAAKTFRENLRIPPGGSAVIRLPLAEVWDRLSPGSISMRVELDGDTKEAEALSWELGKDPALPFRSRLRHVDLRSQYNIELAALYSRKFWWRLDYTGCDVGVDWRNPLPEKDQLGYILMRPAVSQLTYGCLPEQRECEWTPHWEAPEFGGYFQTPMGVPFVVDEKNKMLALINTESVKPWPSAAFLRFQEPVRLEKIYLLTANLTKTLKCYYPGAEVIAHFSNGSEQVTSLVPPYTMSCMIQRFSPRALTIPFGRLPRVSVIASDTHLAVSDVALDPEKPVVAIELRCVTSETIFGIVGLTFLAAR
jgi:hypothetical protein